MLTFVGPLYSRKKKKKEQEKGQRAGEARRKYTGACALRVQDHLVFRACDLFSKGSGDENDTRCDEGAV